MNKKTWLVIILIAAVGLGAFWLFRNRSSAESNVSAVRVAAVLNLTGPAARFDAVKQQALNLAIQRLKEVYPKVSVELKLLDAGGGPEATTVAVRQALDWHASYFLSGTSPTALAIAAQVRGHSPVVVQMANAANPDFGPPRPGEYRFWPDWKQEGEIIWEILQNEKIAKILLIHSADPYSEALTKELKEKAGALTSLTMSDLQYDPAATPDFRPALLRAKQEGV